MREVRVLAMCHRHPGRPDTDCQECVTALEVTHRVPVSELIAAGLTGAWYFPAETTRVEGGSS